MSVSDELKKRQWARVRWLDEATEHFSMDTRVVAAWLWGSEGTGTADALSDFDLFVALADSGTREELERVETWFPQYGQVLWSREVPYNAPTGGRYFTVGFPAPVVPLGIDWYWQPESAAKVGIDTRILVEKRPLPRVVEPTFETFPNVRSQTPFRPPDDPTERIAGQLVWFWSMYGALGKWAARSQDSRVEAELPRLATVAEIAAQYVGAHVRRGSLGDLPLNALRRLAEEMTRLQPLLAQAGVRIPDSDRAWTWLRLAEALRDEGWKPR